MSTETTINMSTVTLMYPDGTIKLMVPTDVPLGAAQQTPSIGVSNGTR